jgi:hypothetical protein
LRPEQADQILLPALQRLRQQDFVQDRRVQIAVALAQMGNADTLPALADWFFSETPIRGAHGFGREMFLDNIQKHAPQRHRQMVERILRDERLDTLGPASTRRLILSVGGYLGQQLAPEEEIRQSQGLTEFQAEGRFEPLPRWHQRLRETVHEWAR